jgi:hypothetical protein
MYIQVETIAYNALPATLTGGKLETVPALVGSYGKVFCVRYVVKAIPAAAKSSRCEDYESVSTEVARFNKAILPN